MWIAHVAGTEGMVTTMAIRPEQMINAPLDQWLDLISTAEVRPGSGAVAGLAAAQAAALLINAALRSVDSWDEARGAAAQAENLVNRAAGLAVLNSIVYEDAVALLNDPEQVEERMRDFMIGRQLASAAEVPLAIGEVAADVCDLANACAEHIADEVRPDVRVARHLAAAVAAGARELVEVNLTVGPDDPAAEAARAHERRANG